MARSFFDIDSNVCFIALWLLVKMNGKKLEKGVGPKQLILRVSEDFHKAVKLNAVMEGVSIQDWVTEACQRSLNVRLFSPDTRPGNEVSSAKVAKVLTETVDALKQRQKSKPAATSTGS